MKVLLIHPEDGLEDGPWTACRWDRIVDLGCSGMESYRQAAKQLGCPVTRLDTFLGEFRDQRKVRDLLAMGLGRLVDRFDLDWWELVSLLVHQQLEVVVLLNELVQTLGPSDEVHISRHGLHASALEMILPSRPRVYPLRPGHAKGSTRHYARVASKFPVRQLLEIFWDKVDCGYQFRGRFTVRPKPATIPVVLLPTAYVNVSRTGVAYARALPGIQFLMVATRPSGWLKQRPANVSMAWLKSYASVGAADRKAEHADLVARWRALQADLSDIPELRMLIHMGAFADVPRRITVGC